MSFVLWQRGDTAIASSRLVMRAAEVPLLAEAQALRDRLEALVTQHERHLADALEAARAEGLAAGREAGLQAARDEVAATLAALGRAAADDRARLTSQVAALALQVARKLMGRLADDERLLALADTAAREMLPAGQPTLWVHPDQVDAVRVRLARIADASGDDAVVRFEVRADAACAPGSCRVENELGSAEASLDTQLDRLASAWGLAGAA